jgi:serine phosphatase RsbU (regulator of sigma subunit)
MAGRWDSAIDYLETSISGGSQVSRADLLPATINSIYASQDLTEAVHFLRRGLLSAFGVSEARVWFRSAQDSLHLVGHVDFSQQSEFSADMQIPFSADRLEARAFRHQVVLRGQEEAQSLVRAIPLMIPGNRPIGVVTLQEEILSGLLAEQRERDLQLAGFLNQATRALQTVISRRQELTLAGRVQASLLPEFEQLPGWQIAASWRPARETSGDFYDLVPFSDGRVGIVIADVVDKGMGAALLMALSRTLIRTYASDHPEQPDRVLGITNRRILTDLDAGLFVTLFYGILDPSTGRMIYSNAGHPPPYLFTSDGLINTLPGSGSLPLGVSADGVWKSFVIEIPAGGLLLLYTDGIPDAQNLRKDFFGAERMLQIVRSQAGRVAKDVQDALISSVYGFVGGEPQLDDITLMVLLRELEPIVGKTT